MLAFHNFKQPPDTINMLDFAYVAPDYKSNRSPIKTQTGNFS